MEAIELLKAYPKAAEVVKAYYLGVLIKSLVEDGVDLPKEFKEQVMEAGVNDEKIAQVIHASPRMLFDVFDEYEIYITIYPINWEKKVQFRYSIEDSKFNHFETRKLAEKAAIEDAFKQLEEKL